MSDQSYRSEGAANVVQHFTDLTAAARIAAGLPLAIADYSTAADQNTVIQALLTANPQKTVRLGKGVWQIDSLTIFPGTTLEGIANKSIDNTRGTVLQLSNLAATYALRVYPTGVEKRNVTIKNLTIDVGASTTASAFLIMLDALATSDITFDNVTFIGTGVSAPAQVWLRDDSHTLYCCGITFINCRWTVGENGRGAQNDTANNTMLMSAPKFTLGKGAVGYYGNSNGNIQIDNALFESYTTTPTPTTTANRSIASKCNVSNGGKNLTLTDGTNGLFTQNDVGHPVVISAASAVTSWITGVAYDGLSASINDAAAAAAVNQTVAISRYSRSTDMPLAACWFRGNKSTIQINASIDEACQYSYVFDACAGDSGHFPAIINNGILQAPINVINGSDLKLSLNGCRILSNCINVDATSRAEVFVDEPSVMLAENGFGKWLPTPKLDDQIAAGGVYRANNKSHTANRPVYNINIGTASGSPVGGQSTDAYSGWINDAATSTGAGSYLDGGAQNWDARQIPFTIPSAVLNTFQYGSTMVQTIPGLVPNAAYDLDLVSGWNGSSFDLIIDINGVVIGKQKIGTANGVAAYELVCGRFRGKANSSGNIVLTITSTGNALLNALRVVRAPDVVGTRRVYRAEITQTGTNAPVANVIENTFNGPIVWTRTGAGFYLGTLAGAFKERRFFSGPIDTSSGPAVKPGRITRNSENIVVLTTAGTDGELVADQSFVEIIVNP